MEKLPGSPSLNPRSPFSPRIRPKTPRTALLPASHKKSSRFSVSGKSAQTSQIVLKTQFFNAERYGNTLPVIVTEALTFADRNTVVSVRISDCGFAWLVCGRRLLLWQYRQITPTVGATPQRRTQGGQCFELTLPQSDLAHRAELVSVFINPGNHSPGCIAVSPEGVIRYWPNVSHEGLSVEQTVDFQGQECDSLCALGGKVDGCILATTTCTIVLVQPKITAGGRHLLSCHTLKTPTGWLGGISKRMSSLIFGPMATEQSGETRLVRVLNIQQSDETWHVYVLAGNSLQKWFMTAGESEQLVYVVELSRVIRDAYQCTAWESCASDPTDIDMWLLDVQVSGSNIMLLSAAVNLHVTPQVQYALIRLDAEGLQTSVQIEEFLLLKLFGLYQEEDTAEFLSYRLLLCDNNVFVYRNRDITIIQPGSEPDLLDFSAIGDKLLGGSVCSNIPVFFSRNQGLLAIYPVDQAMHDVSLSRTVLDNSVDKWMPFDETLSVQHTNLSLYNLEPQDMLATQKDTISQLKAAFLYHVKNQQEACYEILAQLFIETFNRKCEIDSVLDKVAIVISSELLDDVPVGDPRWLNENAGLGSSSSMQIQHQLEDKQEAENLYLQFLQQTGLWTHLSAVKVDNTILATLHVLADHSELLVAAMQLKNLSTTNSLLLQDAIDYAVTELYDQPKPGLTKQDVFYREVTKIYRGFWALVEKCVQVSSTCDDPSQIITIISETNNILLAVLSAVMQFRQQKATFFSPAGAVTQLPVEYHPWILNSGNHGVYESLHKQQSLTLRYGARVCTEGATKASLYDQYVSLVDVILDARKCYVESVRSLNSKQAQHVEMLLKQYQQERQKLIQPLVDDKEWERAALLAEKYLDFTCLVVICENTNNQQRLDDYLDRFKNEDFAQHVFNWYLREGKQGKLLARCRAAARPATRITPPSSLNKFLGTHPQLKWLQHAFEGDYAQAAQTLLVLALEEKDLLTRKKSMLSFAKLSSLVATGVNFSGSFVDCVNQELEMVQIQEEIPDKVLLLFGYDTISPPVLDHVKLAHLCVCSENDDATEYDFHKALKVAEQIKYYENKNELLLHIWCSAVLRDEVWRKQIEGIESPIEALRHTMFYKLTDLAITLGSRVDEVLPPIDILLHAPDLGTLKDETNFQYLIKLGYDYFFRTQMLENSYSM